MGTKNCSPKVKRMATAINTWATIEILKQEIQSVSALNQKYVIQLHLRFPFGQVQSDASSDLVSEANIAKESNDGIEDDNGSHGHIQDTRAAQKVLWAAH